MRPKIHDFEKYHANALNVGLGIQSTAAGLMCINKDLPRPTCFIFADTQWERQGTYANLKRFKLMAENAGIPFHIVTGGNIRERQLDPNSGRTELPYYCDASRFETVAGKRNLLIKDVKKTHKKMLEKLKTQISLFKEPILDDYMVPALAEFDLKVLEGDITDGWKDMEITTLVRQCTLKYKIKPINDFCRKHYGASYKHKMASWVGISTDEWTRMGTSPVKAFDLLYPLVDYGLSRNDCEQYLKDHDYPVPVKSACIGCPLHSDVSWRDLNDEEVEDVANFEEGINSVIANHPTLKDKPYFANGVRVHRSMTPIRLRPFAKTKNEEETERDSVCGAAGCFL